MSGEEPNREQPRKGRRQTESMKNINDTLRLMGILSMQGCGLVLGAFALLHFVLEAMFGLFTLLFGPLELVGELAAVGILALALAWVERQEDEHFAKAAVLYYIAQPWRNYYSGMASAQTPPIEEVFGGKR